MNAHRAASRRLLLRRVKIGGYLLARLGVDSGSGVLTFSGAASLDFASREAARIVSQLLLEMY